MLAAIDSGGPLPYEEDGQTFQNREGLLPVAADRLLQRVHGRDSGSPDRGARRLVIGEGGETYYTDDHYASFTHIDPETSASEDRRASPTRRRSSTASRS